MSTTQIAYPESHINKLALTSDRKYIGVAAHSIGVGLFKFLKPGKGRRERIGFVLKSGNGDALHDGVAPELVTLILSLNLVPSLVPGLSTE